MPCETFEREFFDQFWCSGVVVESEDWKMMFERQWSQRIALNMMIVLLQMVEKGLGYVVDVKVLDIEKRYKSGPKHYVGQEKKWFHRVQPFSSQVYVIQVTWANPNNVFIIYRRYSQFFDLQVCCSRNFVQSISNCFSFSVNYSTSSLRNPHRRTISSLNLDRSLIFPVTFLKARFVNRLRRNIGLFFR